MFYQELLEVYFGENQNIKEIEELDSNENDVDETDNEE